MQVFIIGTPLETARVLDNKRLNKQIIECGQILDAINGKKAWSNHPCTLQYKEYSSWLEAYMNCLKNYRLGNGKAKTYNDIAMTIKPHFHTEEYFNQMKRRLYTKDNEYYNQWKELGTSNENWYYVNNKWIKYINGKKI